MHKVNNNVPPIAFHEIFTKPSHNYPTNFSYNSFSLKKCSLNSTKYSISKYSSTKDLNYGMTS